MVLSYDDHFPQVVCVKNILLLLLGFWQTYEKKRRRKSGPWVNQNTVGINGGDSRKHHLQKVSHTPLMEKRKWNPSKQLSIDKSEDSNSPNLVCQLDFFQTKTTSQKYLISWKKLKWTFCNISKNKKSRIPMKYFVKP